MIDDEYDPEYMEGFDVEFLGGPVYCQGYGWTSPHSMQTRGPVDMKGRPVKRTKTSHPYSYDAFVLIRFRPNVEGQSGVYTDRMQSWDDVAWRRACAAIDGRFESLSPEGWRRFLAAYYPDRELKIVAVEESCNWSSGYPVWCIIFTDPE